MTTAAVSISSPACRLLFWPHPEWWAISLSVVAWFFFFTEAAPKFSVSLPSSSHVGHSNSVPAAAVHWTLMIAAMMFPPLIGQLRVVAARSLWSRRNRALALFLAGYSALWLLFGLAAEMVLLFQNALDPMASVYVGPACFLLAALWQLSPQKRRSLVACHFTAPLAPFGWRAYFDCFRHGVGIAANCCISCWALMFACAAAGHALWAMLAISFVSWSERAHPRPSQGWRSLALSAVSFLALSSAR